MQIVSRIEVSTACSLTCCPDTASGTTHHDLSLLNRRPTVATRKSSLRGRTERTTAAPYRAPDVRDTATPGRSRPPAGSASLMSTVATFCGHRCSHRAFGCLSSRYATGGVGRSSGEPWHRRRAHREGGTAWNCPTPMARRCRAWSATRWDGLHSGRVHWRRPRAVISCSEELRYAHRQLDAATERPAVALLWRGLRGAIGEHLESEPSRVGGDPARCGTGRGRCRAVNSAYRTHEMA